MKTYPNQMNRKKNTNWIQLVVNYFIPHLNAPYEYVWLQMCVCVMCVFIYFFQSSTGPDIIAHKCTAHWECGIHTRLRIAVAGELWIGTDKRALCHMCVHRPTESSYSCVCVILFIYWAGYSNMSPFASLILVRHMYENFNIHTDSCLAHANEMHLYCIL